MNFYLLALMCFLCFAFQVLFLLKEKQEKFVQTLYFKGLASLVFVVVAALSFIFTESNFFVIMIFIGLCFDALADVVFNLRFAFKKIEKFSFISGTFLFFTGHVFYLIALIPQVEKVWLYFIIALVYTAVTQVFIWLTMKNICTGYKIYGAVYIFSVSSMTAMGIGNSIINNNVVGFLLFAIGAVLFLISDMLLIFNSFREKKVYSLRVISLLAYYTAQLLIATGLYYLP